MPASEVDAGLHGCFYGRQCGLWSVLFLISFDSLRVFLRDIMAGEFQSAGSLLHFVFVLWDLSAEIFKSFLTCAGRNTQIFVQKQVACTFDSGSAR